MKILHRPISVKEIRKPIKKNTSKKKKKIGPDGFISKSHQAFEELIISVWKATEHLGGSQNLQSKPDKDVYRARLPTPPFSVSLN